MSVAACGDDDGKNNTPSNNTNNATNNATNNTNNTNNINNTNNTNNVGPDVNEVEPNDETDVANVFQAGQSFAGSIAEGSAEDFDEDYWVVNLSAGTALELTIQNSDTALPVVDVLGPGRIQRRLDPGASATRQFFVPIDGDYFVRVRDARANQEAHGGEDATYEITSSVVTPEPLDISAPGMQAGDVADSAVDVYSFTPAEDQVVIAELFASREPVMSDLDTIIFVWSPEEGGIAALDDIDFQTGNTDSSATFGTTAGQTYWVVVDFFISTNDAAYEIDLSLTDDSFNVPTVIDFDTPATGVIEDRGDDFDSDFFEIEIPAGQTVRVELSASSMDLQPTLAAYRPSDIFGFALEAIANPVGTEAAAEFTNGSDEAASFLIIVDDLRNVPADPEGVPANVGGMTYEYELEVTQTEWMPSSASFPYTTAGSVSLGSFDWFEFTTTDQTFIGARVTTSETDFEPIISYLNDANVAVFGGAVEGFVASGTTTVLGISDATFRGGDTGFEYEPEIVSLDMSSLSFNDLTETEPNDDVAGAEAATLPANITGTLDGSFAELGPDAFKVTLAAGDVVGALTLDGASIGQGTDTILTVIAPDGTTTVTENDDRILPEGTLFSGVFFEAENAGEYTFIVTPFCADGEDPCQGVGDYALQIFTL